MHGPPTFNVRTDVVPTAITRPPARFVPLISIRGVLRQLAPFRVDLVLLRVVLRDRGKRVQADVQGDVGDPDALCLQLAPAGAA